MKKAMEEMREELLLPWLDSFLDLAHILKSQKNLSDLFLLNLSLIIEYKFDLLFS